MESADDLRSSPPKRPKTLAGTLDSDIAFKSKGKEKMEPESEGPSPAAAESPPSPVADDACGICFSDPEWSIRGRIDSCNHFFCFVCIMEWAKIESRCPLCKQRFQSIRRSPLDGVFAAERVVSVPVRDQASHPLGNAPDPYAHVNCTFCHSSTNEELLLLCDLCDSAAHTYCVGLGATVPEGDWYCPDCAATREAFQTNSDSLPEELCNTSGAFRAPGHSVSVYEIVADEPSPELSRRPSTLQVTNGILRRETRDITAEGQEADTNSAAIEAVSSPQRQQNEVGARTLRSCRSLHGRIQALRDNWTFLRSGSLAFSSELFRCRSKKNKKRKIIDPASDPVMTKQQTLTSQVNSQENVANASIHGKAGGVTELQDVSKAWKQMEVAKALKKNQKLKTSGSSSVYKSKLNVSMGAGCSLINSYASRGENLSLSAGVNRSKHTPSMQLKYSSPRSTQQVNTQTMSKMESFDTGPSNVSLSDNVKLPSIKADCFFSKQYTFHRSIELPSEHVIYETSTSSVVNDRPFNSSSVDHSVPAKKPSEFSCKLGAINRKDCTPKDAVERLAAIGDSGKAKYSSRVENTGKLNVKIPSREQHLDNRKEGSSSHVTEKLRRDDNEGNNSKEEIQSLVKLNLRLLSRSQNIGSNRFKEVAQISTHTILAACGLEHSKSKARSFSTSICKHSEQSKAFRRSNLMPNSCRECFYTFVQNVVKSITSEKCL